MTGTATYGFVLYYDLMSAVNAKRCMDGESVHGNKIRVRYLFMCCWVFVCSTYGWAGLGMM